MGDALHDRHRYLDVVFGDRAGFVAVAIGTRPRWDQNRYRHDDWVELQYQWPSQRDKLLRDIEQQLATGDPADFYINPALRLTPARNGAGGKAGSNAAPISWLWADDDHGADVDKVKALRPLVVASGRDGHQHLYVALAQPVPVGTHKLLNRALAEHLGGDSKWSDEALLRMPGTLNCKADPPTQVRILASEPRKWPVAEIAALLGVDLQAVSTARATPRASAATTEPVPDPLPAKVMWALNHADTMDRSKAHHRVVGACAESGLTIGQVLTVCSGYRPSVEKWGDRLRDEVERSWQKVQQPTAVQDDEPELHHGQMLFATRFARTYGGTFLHAHGIGWHRYDGTRWAVCRDGAEHRAVVDLVHEALTAAMRMDSDSRKDALRDIAKVESAAGVAGVLELAGNLHPCTLTAEALDAAPSLLNTKSGTVNLATGDVAAPRASDHLSKVTGASFDPDAKSDLFDKFLETIQPDEDMRNFLARSLGSALLGRVRDHVLLIWHGIGANGKGTLRDAVRDALGDYAIEVSADILLMNRYGQQAMAPERMRLKGARVVFCSEIAEGAKLDEAIMKKLTGGDPVNAKLLYRNPIEFDPSHTILMLTNHLPQVRGDDPATWRRILAVPFDVVVAAEDRDGELPEKLSGASDAILAWLWHGWLDYQKNGLNPPAAVLKATRKYQQDSDILARFLADESVVITGHGSAKSGELYREFTVWLRVQGEDIEMTNKAFSEGLEKRGYTKKRSSSGQRWDQITIVNAGDMRGAVRAA